MSEDNTVWLPVVVLMYLYEDMSRKHIAFLKFLGLCGYHTNKCSVREGVSRSL